MTSHRLSSVDIEFVMLLILYTKFWKIYLSFLKVKKKLEKKN